MFMTRGMRTLFGCNMCGRVNRQFHRANIRSIEQTINVPLLGESITEGSIAKWNVQVGDKVKVDDIVVSIETDKITVDVRCPYNGTITKHFGEPADSVGRRVYRCFILYRSMLEELYLWLMQMQVKAKTRSQNQKLLLQVLQHR